MALSDLTGTTWELNGSLTSYAGGSYAIKTYSVNITTETSLLTLGEETATSFAVIEIGYDSGGEQNVVWLYTSTPTSYTNRASLATGHDTKSLPDTWNSRYGNTFTITGGTDVTNSALISWLEDNCESATPAPPAVPDIAISYAGENIVEMSEAGTKTLKTAGKYLTDNVVLTYSPSGGGGDDGSFKSVIERAAVTPTLPSNLTSVGAYAFHSCSNLALTSLPSGVTSIGTYAFYNCGNLALTSLPSGVTSIDTYAFCNCSSLALTSLPSGLTSIGASAFSSCSNLALTSLPSGVTSISSSAFSGCSNLALTSLPSGVTSIGTSAFLDCRNLALTSLPSGVTSIGTSAFSSCSNLALTSLPSNLTSISNNAFNCCESISSIECNGTITTFGNSLFIGSSYHQMQLASASFPNMAVYSLGTAFGSTTAANACKLLAFADVGKTKEIARNAFANCNALQTLVLRRTDAICTLSNVSAFLNTPMSGYSSLTGTVYVPSALIASYKTATNWKTLYDGGTLTFAAIEGSQYEL